MKYSWISWINVNQIVLFLTTYLTTCQSLQSGFSLFTPADDYFGPVKNSGLKDIRVVHGWKTVDFIFPSLSVRQNLLRSGRYIPGNAIVLDADYWQNDDGERIFVTLPKMKKGIPASLATVSNYIGSDGSPKLQPYPDWSWHRESSCEGIVSAFRTKVDECGRLWVIDSGVTNLLQSANRYCSPKLFAFDLYTDQLVLKYTFPEDVLEKESLLVTIAVDTRLEHCRDTFVYIADVTKYGLIVFNSRKGNSWRVSSNYFYPFPLYGTVNVAGSEFDLMDGVIGLALSPIDKYGFYITAEARQSQSVTQDMSAWGVMFFGLLSPVSIACWNSRLPYIPFNIVTVAQNNETLRFPSGMKVVIKNGGEELLITTSRFSSYYLGKIDETEVNFRILSASVADIIKGTSCDPRNGYQNIYDSFHDSNILSWN